MTDARATKGAIVTTNLFTDDAKELANRNPVELIDGDHLVPLMNEHLGCRWPLLIEVLVRKAEEDGIMDPNNWTTALSGTLMV